MSGYTQKSLVHKLGIKKGQSVYVLNPPKNYWFLLGKLPPDIAKQRNLTKNLDFVHLFTDSEEFLSDRFPEIKNSLSKKGVFWVSWPKQASNVETDLNANKIREIGLKNGLVDVKVAAIDEIWSGLKFIYRLEDQ